MHGLGVRPRAVGLDVGLDDVALEVVGEGPHVVGDAQLLGHPAGVVDVADRAAPGVGLAAPQLHRHAHHLVAGRRAGGRRRPTSRPRPTWPRGPSRRQPPGSRATAAGIASAPVDVLVGGRPAQRQAQGAPGPLGGDAHGRQHVRRLLGAAGAGRRGRRAHAGLVEQEQQRLDSRRPARQRCSVPGSRCRRAAAVVDAAPGIGGQQAVGQAVPQRDPRPGRLVRAAAAAAGRRRSRRCRPRCGCRCAARAPGRRRGPGRAAACPGGTIRAPTPWGPPTLWALSETRSAPPARCAGRARPRPGRRRCGPGRRAPGVGRLGDLGDRLDRADLVVGRHHRDEDGGGVDVAPRASRSTTPAPSTATIVSASGEDRLQDGLVLDGAAQQRPRGGGVGARDGQVVGLGAAAGEDHLVGPAADGGRRRRRGPRRSPACGPGHGVGAADGLPKRSPSQCSASRRGPRAAGASWLRGRGRSPGQSRSVRPCPVCDGPLGHRLAAGAGTRAAGADAVGGPGEVAAGRRPLGA